MSGSTHPSEARLLAYLDGENGAPSDIEAHLAGCEACRQLLEDLRTIADLVSRSRQDDLPHPLWPAMEARCRTPRRPFFSPTFAVGSAAALVVGILIGLWTGSLNPPKQTGPAIAAGQSETQTLWSAVGSTFAGEDDTSWPYPLGDDDTPEGS